MTYQPVIPMSGYTGWRFLQSSLASQKASFDGSAEQDRATAYFRDNIAKIKTAEALVSDRQLLRVALTAFGLEGDVNNRAFLRKILEDGTIKDEALGNRLADKRYLAFAKAFGLGEGEVPKTGQSGFADRIIGRFQSKSFEAAVGEQNEDMRLALNLSSALQDLVSTTANSRARWFEVMGNPPLRKVFQVALGLPDALSRLDIDKQRDAFESRAKARFGTSSVADFLLPENQEKLIRTFLIRSEAVTSATTTAGNVALSLLRSMPRMNPGPGNL